jgi:hypothetical protein
MATPQDEIIYIQTDPRLSEIIKTLAEISKNTRINNANIMTLYGEVRTVIKQNDEIIRLLANNSNEKIIDIEKEEKEKRIISVKTIKYNKVEIPDEEIESMTDEDLKRFRATMLVAKSRYKRDRKIEDELMTTLNIDKIKTEEQKRK